MKHLFNLGLLLVFGLLIFSACDDSAVQQLVFPESNISYSQDVQPFLNQYCGVSNCHDSYAAGGISFLSYGDLFANPFLITPFEPDQSKLYFVIENRSMPPSYSGVFPLTENQIDGIKTWIEEGAEAN